MNNLSRIENSFIGMLKEIQKATDKELDVNRLMKGFEIVILPQFDDMESNNNQIQDLKLKYLGHDLRIAKLEEDAAKMREDAAKLEEDAAKMREDAAKMREDAAKMRNEIDSFKCHSIATTPVSDSISPTSNQ